MARYVFSDLRLPNTARQKESSSIALKGNTVTPSRIIRALALLLVLIAAAISRGQTPLKPKEDPRQIGQRDINKGSLNFISTEKENQARAPIRG